MRTLRYRRVLFLLAAPAAYGLSCLAAAHPEAVESLYSIALYPYIAGAVGRVSWLLPFSLSEILILLLVHGAVAYIVYQAAALIRAQGSRSERAVKLVLNILAFFSLWYAVFVITCGLNYSRLSFKDYSGLDVRDSSPSELALLCGELAEKANSLRKTVQVDENGIMKSSFSSWYGAAKYAGEAFPALGGEYPVLGGYSPRPKPVIFSRIMSHLNITGIFIPFTFEANVNTDTSDYTIPSAMMHELAHYKGFMREDEANFIAYLACCGSGNSDFEYSGVMLALIHSSNALYAADRDIYYEAMSELSEEVRADIGANSMYWRQFEGPVAEVSTAVNNTYLRANRQSDGVKSYGRMVDLLLADYRSRHGTE